MNILVIGSGGREHAISLSLHKSPLTKKLVVAPGNPGIAKFAKCIKVAIDDIEGICKLAKETLQLEEELKEKTPQAALTELFIELKSDQTPAVVERIVNDIDAIVKIVRFPNWQASNAGQREVQKSLRQTLLKYKLHKDQLLFDRAYEYIKEYY